MDYRPKTSSQPEQQLAEISTDSSTTEHHRQTRLALFLRQLVRAWNKLSPRERAQLTQLSIAAPSTLIYLGIVTLPLLFEVSEHLGEIARLEATYRALFQESRELRVAAAAGTIATDEFDQRHGELYHELRRIIRCAQSIPAPGSALKGVLNIGLVVTALGFLILGHRRMGLLDYPLPWQRHAANSMFAFALLLFGGFIIRDFPVIQHYTLSTALWAFVPPTAMVVVGQVCVAVQFREGGA